MTILRLLYKKKSSFAFNNIMSSHIRTLVELQKHSHKLFHNRNLFGFNKNNLIVWKTYNDWYKDTNKYSNFLLSQKINKGDRIGMISNNSYEWATLAYATYMIGGVFVPMYQNQLIEECNYIVNNSDIKILFCNNFKKYKSCVNNIDSKNLDNVFFFDHQDHPQNAYNRINNKKNILDSNLYNRINENDIANIIYTSGTTGKPKGVVNTHKNIISNIKMIKESFDDFNHICNMNDKSVSFLPWAHCYGQTCELNGLISTGGSTYISESIEKLPKELNIIKPTLLYSVPALFTNIYKGVESKFDKPILKHVFEDAIDSYDKKDTISNFKNKIYDKILFNQVRNKLGGNIKHVFVGGASTPINVLKFFEASKLPIIEGYGLTETSPIITLSNLKNRKLGSVGKTLPTYNVKIIDGDIYATGDNIMKEYHMNKEETNKVFKYIDNKKYFKTGDKGYFDSDGYLYINGRSNEEYKLTNGKFVVPGKIEEILLLSKLIKQVIIYGYNRDFNIALIYPNDKNINNLKKEVIDLLTKQKIKSYEIPKEIIIMTEELTVENKLLTPKLSIKRDKVINKYINEINKIYLNSN